MRPGHAGDHGVGMVGAADKVRRAFERPAVADSVVALILLITAFLTVVQLLRQEAVTGSPGQDLAKHVASTLNFRAAFDDGQWLPRIQIDSPYLNDIPLFQFYSSFLGLITFPFLAAGLAPMPAICLAILAIKWIGTFVLFRCARMLGASVWAGMLASGSYLLSPYVISNFYGRVALPETTAHFLLPVLLYGLIRITIRSDSVGIAAIALAIVGLALAHPIFLLYGVAATGLFLLALCKLRPLILGGYAIVAGLLLASFQWLPAMVARNDIPIDLSISPYYAAVLTSYTGLWWFPRALSSAFGEDHLYLTPGILTLPVAALLFWHIRRPMARTALICLLVFLLGSKAPIDFWRYLPMSFLALQFPYRLLAFVALFVALGVALCVPRLRPIQWLVVGSIVLGQVVPILVQKPYLMPIPGDARYLAYHYANFDYLAVPIQLPFVAADRWLLNYATDLSTDRGALEGAIDASGTIRPGNSFGIVQSSFADNYLRITGTAGSAAVGRLALTSTADGAVLAATPPVAPGPFRFLLHHPNDGRRLTLTCIEPASDCAGLAVTHVEALPRNGFQVEANAGDLTMKLEGWTASDRQRVDLWFAHPAQADRPVTATVSVGPGRFETSLPLPAEPGQYMLVSSWSEPAAGSRRLSVALDYFGIERSDGPIQLSPAKLRKIESGGYRRTFVVEAPVPPDVATQRGVAIDLPMAFSSLYRVTQGDHVLPSTPSRQGRLHIETHDTQTPITARFAPPLLSLIGPVVGLLMLVLAPLALRRRTLRPS